MPMIRQESQAGAGHCIWGQSSHWGLGSEACLGVWELSRGRVLQGRESAASTPDLRPCLQTLPTADRRHLRDWLCTERAEMIFSSLLLINALYLHTICIALHASDLETAEAGGGCVEEEQGGGCVEEACRHSPWCRRSGSLCVFR